MSLRDTVTLVFFSRAFLALFCGVLLSLAFPPVGVWPLVLALTPLILLTVNSLSACAAFWPGFFFGVGFFYALPLVAPRKFCALLRRVFLVSLPAHDCRARRILGSCYLRSAAPGWARRWNFVALACPLDCDGVGADPGAVCVSVGCSRVSVGRDAPRASGRHCRCIRSQFADIYLGVAPRLATRIPSQTRFVGLEGTCAQTPKISANGVAGVGIRTASRRFVVRLWHLAGASADAFGVKNGGVWCKGVPTPMRERTASRRSTAKSHFMKT